MKNTSTHRGRRRHGAVAIGGVVGEITAAAFRRHGLGHGEIARAWTEIAGPELAAVSRPERLSWPRADKNASGGRPAGATLTVAVDGPRAVELQYAAPQIIDSINILYGYQAVGRIRLVQATRPIRSRSSVRRRPIEPDNADGLTGIDSAALRSALARLGAATESR